MDLATITTLGGLIGGSLSGVKTGTEIAEKIRELVSKPDVDVTATKQLTSKLLDRLIELQSDHIAMQSALAEIMAQQHRAERFQAEAGRYALQRTDLGAVVYELKPTDTRGEPPHCICATCYDQQIKSVLQPVERNTLGCHRCGGRFLKSDGQGSGIMVGRVRRRDFDGFI